MAPMSDPDAIASQRVLDELMANHKAFLAFVSRRVPSADAAEEILQAAFVKSVEKASTIRAEESSVAWFYRVLRNAVIDYYRRSNVEQRWFEREGPEARNAQIATPEETASICQCMRGLLPTLNPDYAELLRRIDLGETSVTQFAQESGLTPNNTRVKLHRARAALRKQLAVTCGTCAEHGCLDCSCRTEGQASKN